MKKYKYYILLTLIVWWLLPASSVFAQPATIAGFVTDPTGHPIEGAVIALVEDVNIQVVTDVDGKFAIHASPGQTLRVITKKGLEKTVMIHQEPMSITVGQQIPLGYGISQSKEELTGAVSAIETSELVDTRSLIDPTNALYGRLPGVTVLQSGGGDLPPTSTSLFVRGRGTFRDSSPLLLVDGFERPFSSLSFGEIERVTVLKDAAVLARYGQQGANGVVLVTTKRGSNDGLVVTASYDLSFTQPTALPDFVEASVYASAVNEARVNDGRDPLYSSSDLQAFGEGTSPYLFPNVDWFDEVLRDQGIRSNLNTSFRGGGERSQYFATLNYLGDNGLFGPVNHNEGYSTQLNYQRFNFRSNLDIDLTNDLLFQADVAGILIENNRPGGASRANDIFDAMYTIPSTAFPVRTPDGRWGGTSVYDNNPVAILTSSGYGQPNAREFTLTGRLRQNLDSFVEGLSAEGTVSYHNFGEFGERETRSYSYASISPVRDEGGNIVDTTVTVFGEDTDLSFNDSFSNKRQFSDVLGKLNYSRAINRNTVKATVLFHQSERVFDGQDNTFRRRNLVGNLHMGLSGKYFFDLSASYSGNNLLPAGDRYGFFPALSIGWLLTEEDLLQNIGFLDWLKLRTSWGMSGSDLLPTNNPYEINYSSGGSSYWFSDANSSRSGLLQRRLATTNFTYENSQQTNIGVEAKLFEKLDLTVDLFYARRTNILTDTEGYVSEVLGIDPPQSSEGTVDNRGVEGTVKWQDTIGEVAYHLGGQFSFTRNEIVEMNEEFRPYSYLQRTGRPVGQNFGLEVIGFFEDEDDIANSPQQVFSDIRPGDIKYRDQNGDGFINEFDEVPLGYASGYPEIYFSADLGFRYKGIGVSALFQGTGNHTVYLNTPSVFRPLGEDNYTISTYYYDRRWTRETADTATLPRLTTESNANNYRPNNIWLVDGSYVKLRMLEIAYSLPVSWVEQLKLDNLQIYLRGVNLFSIDNVPMLDPEYLGTGYPLLRSYSAGFEIRF